MILGTIFICIAILLLVCLVVKFIKWLFRKASGRPSSSSGGFFDGDFFDGFGDSGGGDSGGGSD